jgi:hypothetical protein
MNNKEILEHTLSRGYRRTIIRPENFKKNRISDFSSLDKIMKNDAVKLYSWVFPLTALVIFPPIHGEDYIERGLKNYEYHEFWRFYQSGQFVHFSGILPDWRDQCFVRPISYQNLSPDIRVLGIGETILYFTLVFEFLSRLAVKDFWDEITTVDFLFGNLENRILWVDEANRFPLFGRFESSNDLTSLTIFNGRKFSKQDLATGGNSFALEASSELFQRFGWNASQDVLKSYQKLYRS